MEENTEEVYYLYDKNGWYVNQLETINDVCFLFSCSEEYAFDHIKQILPMGDDFRVLPNWEGNKTSFSNGK